MGFLQINLCPILNPISGIPGPQGEPGQRGQPAQPYYLPPNVNPGFKNENEALKYYPKQVKRESQWTANPEAVSQWQTSESPEEESQFVPAQPQGPSPQPQVREQYLSTYYI